MANFTRVGYGQVEPNQLSAQKTGQIYASLPLDAEVNVLQNGEFMYYDMANGTVNSGKTAGAGTVATAGEPYLVFNEIKLYEPFWRRSYKDFAMIRVSQDGVTSQNYVTSQLAVNGPVVGQYGGGEPAQGATTVGGDPSATPPIPASDLNHEQYGEGYRMEGFAPRLFKTNIGDIFTTNMVPVGVEYAVGDKLVPTKDNTSKTLVLTRNNSATTGMIWQVVKVYTMPDGQPGLKVQRVQ